MVSLAEACSKLALPPPFISCACNDDIYCWLNDLNKAISKHCFRCYFYTVSPPPQKKINILPCRVRALHAQRTLL